MASPFFKELAIRQHDLVTGASWYRVSRDWSLSPKALAAAFEQ
jgi:hypothetical protein